MSDNMNSKRVALFGVGRMGLEYVKVLRSLGVQIAIVVGRSQQGIDAFEAQCGIQALPYSSKQWESVCLSGIDCGVGVSSHLDCHVRPVILLCVLRNCALPFCGVPPSSQY